MTRIIQKKSPKRSMFYGIFCDSESNYNVKLQIRLGIDFEEKE